MAQTITLTTISNDKTEITEVLNETPNKEDILFLAEMYNICGNIKAEYESYNIGEGEVAEDEYFSEIELLSMYESGNFEKEINSKGYRINKYDDGYIDIVA